jgi:HSP20 family protein
MNRKQNIRNIAAVLTFGSILTMAPVVFAAEPPSTPKGWGEEAATRIRKFQNHLSKIFRDTHDKDVSKAAYSASVDVREGLENYTVRIHLPERDVSKVDVSLDGRTLRIAGEQSYEQSIVLRHAKPDAKLDTERQEHTIVVTVPKGEKQSVASSEPSLQRSPFLAPDKWEQDVLSRMETMRKEMDRAFDTAFKEFRLDSQGFFDKPEFGSSFDLTDEKDHYVVRAYLPGRDTQGVEVTVEGQTLKISAKAEIRKRDENKSGIAESFSVSNYAQTFTLPGPVDGQKKKVERKEGLVEITITKKGS